MLIWLAWANERTSVTRSIPRVPQINTPSPKRLFLQSILTKRFDCLPTQQCLRWLVAFCVPALPMSWQLSVQHLGFSFGWRCCSKSNSNHLRPQSGVTVKVPSMFLMNFREFCSSGKEKWYDSLTLSMGCQTVPLSCFQYTRTYRTEFLSAESQMDTYFLRSTLLSFLLTGLCHDVNY